MLRNISLCTLLGLMLTATTAVNCAQFPYNDYPNSAQIGYMAQQPIIFPPYYQPLTYGYPADTTMVPLNYMMMPLPPANTDTQTIYSNTLSGPHHQPHVTTPQNNTLKSPKVSATHAIVKHKKPYDPKNPEYYSCTFPECEYKTIRNSDLTKHKNIHVSEALLPCDTCNKLFKTPYTLKRHQRVHRDAVYSCPLCSQTFSQSKNIPRHIRIVHNNEKAFKCEHCEKTFSSAFNREEHTRLHTGELPFSCAVCGEAFRTQSKCKDHYKRHTDQQKDGAAATALLQLFTSSDDEGSEKY